MLVTLLISLISYLFYRNNYQWNLIVKSVENLTHTNRTSEIRFSSFSIVFSLFFGTLMTLSYPRVVCAICSHIVQKESILNWTCFLTAYFSFSWFLFFPESELKYQLSSPVFNCQESAYISAPPLFCNCYRMLTY